ncbi:YgcG family protein [Sphingomonas sp. 28-63-12]|uniref:TPM domain-containing protein n=1 Tax=Sphingomonas sp. 28-63-12 TaxID=1970434 RepID=UPI000BD4F883|nr:MAG: methanol dehydrogenase [Sphingomonas sp. 28-63-12]
MFAFIAALFLSGGAATAQTFPPLTGQVVDAAHILNPAQIAALTAQSAEIEKTTTRQFIVATIPDLQGYPIEDYGYRLGRAWKIGQKDANNGIILIIAPNDRKVRIEVGYGLEPIMTDALSSQIIRNTILPRFKVGDLPGGIIAGASEIATQMKLPLEAGEARAAALAKQNPKAARSKDSPGDWVVAIIVMLIIFFVVLPMLFGRAGGRRYHGGDVAGTVGNVILWSALNSLSDRGGGSGWGGGSGGGGSDWGGGGGGSFGGGGSSGSW